MKTPTTATPTTVPGCAFDCDVDGLILGVLVPLPGEEEDSGFESDIGDDKVGLPPLLK